MTPTPHSSDHENTAAGLDGKVALVTGASSGIGAASARALAAVGASVVLLARHRDRLEAVAGSIRARGGIAHPLVCDLDQEEGPAQAVAEAVAVAGGPDILVHSAGRFEAGTFRGDGVASLDRMYRTNVRAPFALTAASLPHLRGGGAVIFIASVAAFAAFPEAAAYCASKGAVDALVAALALELAPEGVRVNAIAPGEIETPMNADYYLEDPDYRRRITAVTPAGRLGAPEDIGSVVAFLASDAARFVHGATLVVDGGLTASIPGSIAGGC